MQIDHDPNEPKRDNERSLWPWVFLMSVVFTGILVFYGKIDFWSAMSGASVAFSASFWYVDWMRYDLFKSWRGANETRDSRALRRK